MLDMGASAIRLVIAEMAAGRSIRVVEEASRGVLLGRDTFSSGAIRSQTVDAAIAALEGFRQIMDGYGVQRSPRGGDQRGPRSPQRRHVSRSRSRPHRHRVRDHQRGRGEPAASIWPSARHCAGTPALRGAWTLLVEVGGGSTSLTLLRRGAAESIRRLRARRGPAAPAARPAAAHPRRAAGAAQALDRERRSRRSRSRSRSKRVTHMVAIGGDVRFAASQILEERGPTTASARFPRDAFLAFCDEVERLDEEQLVERFRLPAVEAETLRAGAARLPDAAVGDRRRAELVVSDASLRAGMLLDLRRPGRPPRAPRTSSARCWPAPRRSATDTASIATHGRHVAMLAMRLFDELPRRARPRRPRAAAAAGRRRCCTTSASTSACARITSTRSTCWRRRRFSGCPTTRPRSSPTSRATIAGRRRSGAICRTSRSIGRIA